MLEIQNELGQKNRKALQLSELPGEFAIVKIGREEAIPAWVLASPFFSITRTAEELSIVCQANQVPDGCANHESEWRCLKVEGPLPFSLTGVLSALTQPLARENISIFALSTFNTDYLLVKSARLEEAKSVLLGAGFKIHPPTI